MENKVTKLITKHEENLKLNLEQLELFLNFIETGKVDKFIVIALHKEDGLISYSSPTTSSYYEYVGFMEAVKEYLIHKANANV